MNPSSNLFLIGPTGAGKTALGKRLADHYKLEFIDLDQAIVAHTGADIPTIFDIEGEAGFRKRETEQLGLASGRQRVLLATGAGAVLAEHNRELLRGNGFVVWLDITIDEQVRRLARKKDRPLLQGVDPRQRLAHMAHVRTPLYRDLAELYLKTSDEPILHTLRCAIQQLDTHWQQVT